MFQLPSNIDDQIKAALKKHRSEGTLADVAEVTGIAGGTEMLKSIMNTEGELHIMDRGMLAMHLGLCDFL